MSWSVVLCVFAIGSVVSLVIEIPNPPPEQLDPEWTLIPDEDNNLHLVNVKSALNEPQPRFNVETGVIFELYTRSNPHDAEILRVNDLASLASSSFNASRPTRIMSHGWNSKGDLTHSFGRTYFGQANLDVNFIAVNWQAGSNTINYISARNRVNSVDYERHETVQLKCHLSHFRNATLQTITPPLVSATVATGGALSISVAQLITVLPISRLIESKALTELSYSFTPVFSAFTIFCLKRIRLFVYMEIFGLVYYFQGWLNG